MHLRKRNHHISALTALACTFLLSKEAVAYHDGKLRLRNNTAHTLPDGEIHLGLWKVQWGAWDNLTVGSYTTPWLALAVPDVDSAPNAHLKWRMWSNDTWAVGAEVGFTRIDFASTADNATGGTLLVVPFELAVSYQFNDDWSFSTSILTTETSLEGSLGDAFGGTAAVSNTQWTATAEWRLTKVTALTCRLQVLADQRVGGDASTTADIDDFTTAEIHGSGSSDVLNYEASSITPGVRFSWETFNLRLGLSIGNFNVPIVNFVAESQSPVPDFAAYWVF